jgi:LPXTG-motif cell wall-anchored protein
MRHWLVLAGLYAAIVALVLPGSPLAQQIEWEAAPPAEPAPVSATEAAPPTEAAPAEPEPAAAPPEPAAAPPEQDLGDERGGLERDDEPRALAAATTSVTVSDFQFAPAQITIQQGDTVTWTNDGPTPHSSTSEKGVWDTGIFPEGERRSQTFNEAGTFAYICTPHPNMTGTVVVEASASGGGDEPVDDGSSAGGGGSSAGTGADGAESSDDGPSLPATGSETWLLAVIGVAFLAVGFAIQRRQAA